MLFCLSGVVAAAAVYGGILGVAVSEEVGMRSAGTYASHLSRLQVPCLSLAIRE